MIRGIYDGRKFFVHDHTGDSSIYLQEAGIAQGCPLSPFLFIIVQTVMFYDIYNSVDLQDEPEFVVTRELLYADETVLLSARQDNLQQLPDAIVTEGAKYGLELNWEKTFQINVGTDACTYCPNGNVINQKESVIYLGGSISADSSVTIELNRRLSESRNAFNLLRKLWSHVSLSISRKLEVFNECITSKVMYVLDSVWLLKVGVTRLDAFQCVVSVES